MAAEILRNEATASNQEDEIVPMDLDLHKSTRYRRRTRKAKKQLPAILCF